MLEASYRSFKGGKKKKRFWIHKSLEIFNKYMWRVMLGEIFIRYKILFWLRSKTTHDFILYLSRKLPIELVRRPWRLGAKLKDSRTSRFAPYKFFGFPMMIIYKTIAVFPHFGIHKILKHISIMICFDVKQLQMGINLSKMSNEFMLWVQIPILQKKFSFMNNIAIEEFQYTGTRE